jgi:hypothetical protein
MPRRKEAPQLRLDVLAKIGAALRNHADKVLEEELPPRIRSLLAKLEGENTSAPEQSAHEQPADPPQRSRTR